MSEIKMHLQAISALILASLFALPACLLAEEKFLSRDPKAAEYSALCAFYRQEDLPKLEYFESGKIADFRACTLKALDLSIYPPKVAMQLSFDSSSIWPAKDKLPKKFKPYKILKHGTKSEKVIKLISKSAKKGSGIAIGIIGRPPLLSHKEYENSLAIYKQYALSPLASRQATAALGMLSGKRLGFLPKSIIYYISPLSYGKTSGARDILPEAKALRQMLELNSKLPEERKIKAILLLYRDYKLALDGKQTMAKAKKEAKAQNVALFSADEAAKFQNYAISNAPLIRAASPAHNEAYSIEAPGPEVFSAWLMGLYLCAKKQKPNLNKEDFFFLLRLTAKKPKPNAKALLRPLLIMDILKQLY